MARTWAPVAVEVPVLEANGVDRTGPHARALGRPKPWRGEKPGHLVIRFSVGFEREDLRPHRREPVQVTQSSHGTGDVQRTDGPPPCHPMRVWLVSRVMRGKTTVSLRQRHSAVRWARLRVSCGHMGGTASPSEGNAVRRGWGLATGMLCSGR
jgi:hypothetical protein